MIGLCCTLPNVAQARWRGIKVFFKKLNFATTFVAKTTYMPSNLDVIVYTGLVLVTLDNTANCDVLGLCCWPERGGSFCLSLFSTLFRHSSETDRASRGMGLNIYRQIMVKQKSIYAALMIHGGSAG